MVNRGCQQVVRARGRQTAAGEEGAGAWLIATVVARARFATVVMRVRFGIDVGRNKCQRGDGIDGDDGKLGEGRVVGSYQPPGVGASPAESSELCCLPHVRARWLRATSLAGSIAPDFPICAHAASPSTGTDSRPPAGPWLGACTWKYCEPWRLLNNRWQYTRVYPCYICACNLFSVIRLGRPRFFPTEHPWWSSY